MLTVVPVLLVLVFCSVVLLVMAAWTWRALVRFDRGMVRGYAEIVWRCLFPARPVGWEVIERRILARMRRGVTISVGGVCVVPCSFRVSLSTEDLDRMSGVRSFVESDLSRRLHSEARRHGWRCDAPPAVSLGADPAAPSGFPIVEAAFSEEARGDVGLAAADLPPSRTVGLPRTPTTIEGPARARSGSEKGLPMTSTQPWVETDLVGMDGADGDFGLSDRTDDLPIGRSTDCDMVLDVPTVSDRHARLRRVAGGWEVEDLGSLNGTFRNGTRITGAVMLSHGDYLSFSCRGPRFRYTRLEPSLAACRGTRTGA